MYDINLSQVKSLTSNVNNQIYTLKSIYIKHDRNVKDYDEITQACIISSIHAPFLGGCGSKIFQKNNV